MNRIEIQQTGGFPLESDTLTFLQDAFDSLNKFGYLAGNSMIIYGCNESNGNVSDGWVFANGELMPFEGGALGNEVRIVETTEERIFENGESKAVYHKKKAMFGSPGIPWTAFQRPKTLYEIKLELEQIKRKLTPVGTIVMWAGDVGEIPTGWKLCDGNNGTPDLRSKFIVGYNPHENDYNTIGKTGGAKTVTLTEAQMPKHKHDNASGGGHSHSYADSYYIENSGAVTPTKVPGTSLETLPGNYVGSGKTDSDNNRILYRTRTTGSEPNHTHNMSEKGSDQAHENRPPYYTLAFIQFKNN